MVGTIGTTGMPYHGTLPMVPHGSTVFWYVHVYVPLVPLWYHNGTLSQKRTRWYHVPWYANETVLREAMQAVVRVQQAHMLASEDYGGDPRCRHRCRVGTVVTVMSSMLTTPTS